MATRPISAGYGLYQALKDEGYELPAECGNVEMRLPVDGIIQLALIVNLTDGPDGTLAKFGRALVRMANWADNQENGDGS